MANEKKWPRPGDLLTHRFRKRGGEVAGEVLSVDRETGKVAIRVGDKAYPSLSTASLAITGQPTNGWVFWGLKKQKVSASRTRRHSSK